MSNWHVKGRDGVEPRAYTEAELLDSAYRGRLRLVDQVLNEKKTKANWVSVSTIDALVKKIEEGKRDLEVQDSQIPPIDHKSSAQLPPPIPVNASCQICCELILPKAKKCKHCHSFLDDEARRLSFHPGTAAVLSLFVPGAGQVYRGQIFLGLLFLICAGIGYYFVIFPGVIIHITSIVAAGDPPRISTNQNGLNLTLVRKRRPID